MPPGTHNSTTICYTCTVMSKCIWCYKEFKRPHTKGPEPKYCTTSHRQRFHEHNKLSKALDSLTIGINIPDTMKNVFATQSVASAFSQIAQQPFLTQIKFDNLKNDIGIATKFADGINKFPSTNSIGKLYEAIDTNFNNYSIAATTAAKNLTEIGDLDFGSISSVISKSVAIQNTTSEQIGKIIGATNSIDQTKLFKDDILGKIKDFQKPMSTLFITKDVINAVDKAWKQLSEIKSETLAGLVPNFENLTNEIVDFNLAVSSLTDITHAFDMGDLDFEKIMKPFNVGLADYSKYETNIQQIILDNFSEEKIELISNYDPSLSVEIITILVIIFYHLATNSSLLQFLKVQIELAYGVNKVFEHYVPDIPKLIQYTTFIAPFIKQK